MYWLGSSLFTVALLVVAIIVIVRAIRVVPQQHAWIVERLGRFNGVLEPGLNFVIPFVDRIAYKHDLREIPLDVPSQICITRDNTQLQVDGILYFQVTDPKLASYGSSNYVVAITQLAQTTLRSIIGRMELDKTFEERDQINASVVTALDQAAASWGVKVLRYEIKDLTPPAEILRSMQAQITAEREKRAVIATSEGRRQEQINVAQGAREAAIAKSEGEKQAEINNAQGQAAAILSIAEANAKAIRQVAESIEAPGGLAAVNFKIAEQYVAAFGNLAIKSNTMILPQNAADIAGMVATAMSVIRQPPPGARSSHAARRFEFRGDRRRVGPRRGDGADGRRGRRARGDRRPQGRRRRSARARAGRERPLRPLRRDQGGRRPGRGAGRGDAFGGVQGLVNCAGIVHGEKVLGKAGPHTLAGFERAIAINLVGTFNLLRLAAQAMAAGAPNEDGERGVIVNTASVAAFDGQVGQAAYAASKAAVVGMTLPVARELARERHPRDDDRARHLRDADDGEPHARGAGVARQMVPFPPRLGRASEFAALVRAIVENPMLNGETIRLDGAIRMAPAMSGTP